MDVLVRVVYERDGTKYAVSGGTLDSTGTSSSQIKGKLNDDTKFTLTSATADEFRVTLCAASAAEPCDAEGLDRNTFFVEVEFYAVSAGGDTVAAGIISDTLLLL